MDTASLLNAQRPTPDSSASACSAAEFRRVLSCLPTGVTIVTAFTPTGPVGMTVNSFTSVSLDPPLVLICPAKSSRTWSSIRAARRFCVNILAGHHEDLGRRFAKYAADRFAGVGWRDRRGGPAIADAAAWIDAELVAEHDGGDHTIAVGRVLSLEEAAASRPLVFFRGQFTSLGTPQLALG